MPPAVPRVHPSLYSTKLSRQIFYRGLGGLGGLPKATGSGQCPRSQGSFVTCSGSEMRHGAGLPDLWELSRPGMLTLAILGRAEHGGLQA